MSYHGNLNTKQTALVEKLKKDELSAIANAIRRYLIIRDKTRAGGGVYAENDGKGKPHMYKFHEVVKKLNGLHFEYDKVYRMALPEFLRRFPRHRAQLLKENPGEFEEVKSQSGKLLFLLVIVFAAMLPAFFKNIFNEKAILVFILIAGTLAIYYAALHKRPPKLVAVKA